MELRDIYKNERSNICQVQLFVMLMPTTPTAVDAIGLFRGLEKYMRL